MVQPTKIASRFFSSNGMNVVVMTPLQAIDYYLRSPRSFACFQTLIVDEVHTRTVEYHTFLSILRRKNMSRTHRIILMSATADPDFLSRFFQTLRTYEIPVSSPFPVEVVYHPPADTYGFINSRGMLPVVRKILRDYPGHERVLVFVYTHEQCEKLTEDLQKDLSEYNGGKTFALYGGMMPDDVEHWNQFLVEQKKFLVVATNVAETSITIPGLSLIIDFGIQCVQQNNRIVYRHCSKSSLQQRMGRTGRTCPGTVVRCMTELEYNHLPVQDDPELHWDLIVLRMLRYGLNPSHLLPQEVAIEKIVQKFIFYGLLDDKHRMNSRKVQFVLNCPMSMRNSCLLYSFLQSHDAHSYDNFLMFVIAIATMDCCETRMIRIYYYKRDRRMSKTRFLEFISDTFAGQLDELEIHLNILLSCVFASNPVEFSNAFSLNYRSIRQLSASIHKVMSFACNYLGKTSIEWKTALRTSVLYGNYQRKDLSGKNKHNVCMCSSQAMDMVHTQLFRNMCAPCLLSYNDLAYRSNFVTEFYNCILRPYTSTSSCNHCIIPLGYDDNDIAMWGDRSKNIDQPIIISFSMYTLAPRSINNHILGLRECIRHDYLLRKRHKMQKDHQKEKFKPVLEDIREDVAYRPGQWKMLEMIGWMLEQKPMYNMQIMEEEDEKETSILSCCCPRECSVQC